MCLAMPPSGGIIVPGPVHSGALVHDQGCAKFDNNVKAEKMKSGKGKKDWAVCAGAYDWCLRHWGSAGIRLGGEGSGNGMGSGWRWFLEAW